LSGFNDKIVIPACQKGCGGLAGIFMGFARGENRNRFRSSTLLRRYDNEQNNDLHFPCLMLSYPALCHNLIRQIVVGITLRLSFGNAVSFLLQFANRRPISLWMNEF
jgi:hypothetical protein